MLPKSPLTRRGALRYSAAVLSGLFAGCGDRNGGSRPSFNGSFKPLFNGHDLTGWEGDTLLWVVEEGMLIGRSPGIAYNDFLATQESYRDFVLRLKVHLVGGRGNSGIQFRSRRMKGSMEMIGYQADIGSGLWGDLYDESRRRRALVKGDLGLFRRVVDPDGWNDYEIRAAGAHIELKLNGETTVDYQEPEADIEQTGLIALQVHSGRALEVRFKDIQIHLL